jgi:Uncharacterized conserved protein
MRYFIGIVHNDEDSAYGIHFPDVPGCFSAADDLDDLPAAASEALSLWLEDAPQDITPRSMAELRADADVQAALKDGAFLMSVPMIALTGRTVKANLTMDAGLLDAIDRTAKARNLTRSAFLADLARREIVA